MRNLTDENRSGERYVGNPTVRSVDGPDKVSGRARYVADMSVPGMLHAQVLRSSVPHARIMRLDVTPALRVPGVVAAITHEDFVDHGSFGWPIKDMYILAYRKVRYVGEPVAVVAAETLEAAQAGIAAIVLELEPLPVVGDMTVALDPDMPLIPEQSPTGKGNLCERHIVRNGDPDPILAGCPVVLDVCPAASGACLFGDRGSAGDPRIRWRGDPLCQQSEPVHQSRYDRGGRGAPAVEGARGSTAGRRSLWGQG